MPIPIPPDHGTWTLKSIHLIFHHQQPRRALSKRTAFIPQLRSHAEEHRPSIEHQPTPFAITPDIRTAAATDNAIGALAGVGKLCEGVVEMERLVIPDIGPGQPRPGFN